MYQVPLHLMCCLTFLTLDDIFIIEKNIVISTKDIEAILNNVALHVSEDAKGML